MPLVIRKPSERCELIMPKLSEILGGITKDITQAQITSDLTSLEYFEYYQQDELLKLMDVPRLKIKDISINLKFAIAETSGSQISDNAKSEVANVWRNHVANDIAPKVLLSLINEPNLDQVNKKLILTTQKNTPLFQLSGDDILTKKRASVSKQSEDYVISLVKGLPESLRKKLPALKDIRQRTNEVVNADLLNTEDRLHKVAVAKSAEDFDLDIQVLSNELKEIPETQIHEISLSIGLDDNPINS